MMVTPLRDGMNLVAKEYVAARADHGGALVLSRVRRRRHASCARRSCATRTTSTQSRTRCCGPCTSSQPEAAPPDAGHATSPAHPRRGGTGRESFLDRARRARDGGRRERAPSTSRRHRTAGTIDPELRAAIGRIARVPQLLVACDYDGTLAPIVEDPTKAVPLPEAVAAVRALAALPQTTVAVVSGRALRDLAALSRLPSEVHLVGSHGSEFDVGFVERLAPELVALRTRLRNALRELAANHPGVRLERKPASVAVHTRGVDPRGRRRRHRGGPQRPGDLARRHRHPGQGGHRAVRGGHPQGHRGRPAAHPARRPARCCSSATTSPTRTPSATCTARTSASRSAPATTQADYRVADPIEAARALGAAAGDPAALALRRAGGADRAALDAGQRADASRCSPRRPRSAWLCHPKPGLGGDLRRPGRRQPGRPLLVAPRARRHPAGPALPPRHDDRGDPLVRADRHRLAGPAGTETTPDDPALVTGDSTWSGCSPVRPGPGGVRPAARVRPGRRRSSQPLGDGLLVLGSNDPIALYSPGVEWEVDNDGGYETAHARGRPRRRRRRRSCWSCASAPEPGAPPRCTDPRAAGRGRAALAGLGRPRCGCPRTARDLVAAQRADPARAVPRGRPARSWPRRPRRCPRSSAASATGTTATAGCATRR